ncbi:hypothetical protein MUY27_01830 [Mucilaginibacter sp. RS28]|uniref:Acyl esterase n=1 Tax=Mucilaginibacter straminoryzae TaxID=2932774 RepID=A0A9X1X4H6_9SPHI|nr:hypothetical protein [Mucilaginibacter straminoryzae]MCJ8208429.1 hypothetical protein [Mucilaginibacter straminoryzae]
MSKESELQSPIKETGLSYAYRFSICTLVTDLTEYQEMMDSFIAAGFNESVCEFRYVDNSQINNYDAYEGINLFLQNALGEYIIICHQDVLANIDTIDQLNNCIKQISVQDPNWAILSNAGGLENDLYNRFVLNVAYPDGKLDKRGNLPQKVISVDENFILVKKAANLSLSRDLKGFHLYGTDLCLIADLLGYTAYVVDFKITHKSLGNPDGSYQSILTTLMAKYNRFMQDRRIVTTITDFYLSSSPFKQLLHEVKLLKKLERNQDKIRTKKTKRQQ